MVVHIKLEFSDQIQALLQDIANGKEEKFCFSILRKVADYWNRTYLTMISKGYLYVGDRIIPLTDIKIEKIEDEKGEELLVLGDKITEQLEHGYVLVKILNPQLITMLPNEWVHQVIVEGIVTEKADVDSKELKEEEDKL